MIVLTACPAGLRGHLTRWLLEVSAGVYVGSVSSRVREHLWLQVVENVKSGKAIMIHQSQSEQRLAFKTHLHEWDPVDFDGINLIRRPADNETARARTQRGWSTASHRRRRR
ncbi:type I-E CRISPR-associated endoribonuclease Cas2e [Tsukamurella sp. NPDC003166]|uniref:type I-E CRISPR-associated endoribonuclease Cas2e n=1 Tax=Tsukamurella sp. NPDC003166 TaxID=3154444 RepID=UPI0033B2DB2E